MLSKEVRQIIFKNNLSLEEKIKAIDPEVMAVIREDRVRAVAECSTRIMQQVDTCYTAAIINQNVDAFTLLDLEEIRENADKYLIENGDFIKEFKEEWKNYLNKVDLEVGERIQELLEDKLNQAEIFKIIKKEYPKLKSSHINLAYKGAKTEWLKPKFVIANEKIDRDRETARTEVLKANGVEKVEEVIKTTEKCRSEVKKGRDKMSKKVKEVEEVKVVASPFTVKTKTVVLEGQHSDYKIEDGTLVAGKILFRGKEDIENYCKSERDNLEEVLGELQLAWLEV